LSAGFGRPYGCPESARLRLRANARSGERALGKDGEAVFRSRENTAAYILIVGKAASGDSSGLHDALSYIIAALSDKVKLPGLAPITGIEAEGCGGRHPSATGIVPVPAVRLLADRPVPAD